MRERTHLLAYRYPLPSEPGQPEGWVDIVSSPLTHSLVDQTARQFQSTMAESLSALYPKLRQESIKSVADPHNADYRTRQAQAMTRSPGNRIVYYQAMTCSDRNIKDHRQDDTVAVARATYESAQHALLSSFRHTELANISEVYVDQRSLMARNVERALLHRMLAPYADQITVVWHGHPDKAVRAFVPLGGLSLDGFQRRQTSNSLCGEASDRLTLTGVRVDELRTRLEAQWQWLTACEPTIIRITPEAA